MKIPLRLPLILAFLFSLQAFAQDNLLEQALAQESARRGLTERLDVQRALVAARRNILIQALQTDVSKDVPVPSDAEVKAYFEKNKENTFLKEAVKADVYLLDGSSPTVLEVARTAVKDQEIKLNELQKTRFKQVAQADTGWVMKDALPLDVWTELLTLPQGKVRFFKVEDNYLLIKYQEHREKAPATLEDAREDIRKQLLLENQQAAWDRYLETTRKKIGLTE